MNPVENLLREIPELERTAVGVDDHRHEAMLAQSAQARSEAEFETRVTQTEERFWASLGDSDPIYRSAIQLQSDENGQIFKFSAHDRQKKLQRIQDIGIYAAGLLELSGLLERQTESLPTLSIKFFDITHLGTHNHGASESSYNPPKITQGVDAVFGFSIPETGLLINESVSTVVTAGFSSKTDRPKSINLGIQNSKSISSKVIGWDSENYLDDPTVADKPKANLVILRRDDIRSRGEAYSRISYQDEEIKELEFKGLYKNTLCIGRMAVVEGLSMLSRLSEPHDKSAVTLILKSIQEISDIQPTQP
jgi:hypothetical protein